MGRHVTVAEKQRLFGRLLPRLLDKAQELHPGGVVVGEVERSNAAAKWNAEHGKGISNSLHLIRLAVDIHLFDDVDEEWHYLPTNESHRTLGEWWEQQHELCRWGGRFGDGNHYSLEHEGVK